MLNKIFLAEAKKDILIRIEPGSDHLGCPEPLPLILKIGLLNKVSTFQHEVGSLPLLNLLGLAILDLKLIRVMVVVFDGVLVKVLVKIGLIVDANIVRTLHSLAERRLVIVDVQLFAVLVTSLQLMN